MVTELTGRSCLAAGTEWTRAVRGESRSPGRSTAPRTARPAARLARLESAGGRSLVCSPRRRQVAAAGETVGVGGSREEERETVGCGGGGTQSKEMVDCSNNKINFLPNHQIYQVQHQNFNENQSYKPISSKQENCENMFGCIADIYCV